MIRTGLDQGGGLLVTGPLFDGSPEAADARGLLLAAEAAGLPLRAIDVGVSECALDPDVAGRLRRIMGCDSMDSPVHLFAGDPAGFPIARGTERQVARCAFPTDRLPGTWAARLNRMDEVWVPSSFHLQTFARSGTDLSRIRVVHPALEARCFEPAVPERLGTSGAFVFLAFYDGTERSGWDLLVTAYCQAFTADDAVSLVLRIEAGAGSAAAVQERVETFLLERLGVEPDQAPRITFLADPVPPQRVPGLLAACDAFVCASRGETYGREVLEAMAACRPVIATRWGVLTDYLHARNSYLVDAAPVPVSHETIALDPSLDGHTWAEPVLSHLAARMAQVVDRPEAARRLAEAARDEVEARFGEATVGRRLRGLLAAQVSPAAAVASTVPVQWPEIRAEHLGAIPDLVTSVPGDRAVRVYTGSPTDLPPVVPGGPARVWTGAWSYRKAPASWVAALKTRVDEVWVPTRSQRRSLLEEGFEPDTVVHVPSVPGPRSGPAEPLPTRRAVRVVFPGPLRWDAGADLALRAFAAAFRSTDDIALVLASDPTRDAPDLLAEVAALSTSVEAPEVVLAGSVSWQEADLCLAPFRAEVEGFSALAALAAGVPVVGSALGPLEQLLDSEVGWGVPGTAWKVPGPCGGVLEVFEVDAGRLACDLAEAVEEAETRRMRGAAAFRRVAGGVCAPDRVAATVRTRCAALAGVATLDDASRALDRAAEELLAALEPGPDDERRLLATADALLRLERMEEAALLAETLLQRCPGHPAAQAIFDRALGT